MIKKLLLIVVVFFGLISFAQSETSWIKKKDKSEKIEKVKKKETSNWIKKKDVKKNKKKLKEKIKDSKSWITKKSKDKVKDIKEKLKKHKTVAQLPKADFYFAAIIEPKEDEEAQYIYGYVKSDKSSKKFSLNGKKYFSKSDGIAYFDNKENRCEVDSQSAAIGSTMFGEVILKCKKGLKMAGGYRQTGSVGKGDGSTSDGNNVTFEFYTSKNFAIAKLNDLKSTETQLVERKLPSKKKKKILLNPNGKYYALLIGNSKYDDEGLVQLDSPVNDINEIEKVLNKSYKFEKIIPVKNGTKKQIFDGFKELSKLTTTNDYVFIYYSGHGDTRAQQAYWIPKDGSAEWGSGDWININELNIFLTEIKAHHLAVMVDSCYVGGKFKGTNVLDVREDDGRIFWTDKLGDSLNLRSRSVLASGSSGRVSDTAANTNHSKFALSFLNLLKFADRESIPVNLFSVALNIRNTFEGDRTQQPYYYYPDTWAHGGGDFIFIPKKNYK